MKDVRIEIKNAPGIIVYAFSDIDGDDFLFYKEVISSFSLLKYSSDVTLLLKQ